MADSDCKADERRVRKDQDRDVIEKWKGYADVKNEPEKLLEDVMG